MSVSLSGNTRITRVDRVLFAQVGDEFLALDSQLAECFSLNETAKRIWDLIAEARSIDQICGELGAEYEVDDRTCQSDVIDLLIAWRDAGLISLDDAG